MHSSCGDVLLALPALLLHEGKGCSWHPQVVFTMSGYGTTWSCCPQMPGYHLLPIHPISGLVLPGSRVGQSGLAMTAAHWFFPSFIPCLFLFLGTGKQFSSVLPLLFIVVTVLRHISPSWLSEAA